MPALVLAACGGGDSSTRQSQSATPQYQLPAVTGIAPPLATIDANWRDYSNIAMGLTLRYPGDWQLKEEDQSAILLYPASADPQEAAEVISFQFRSDIPYQPESSQAGKTDPKPIAVSGLNGVYREDTALAIPTESYSIELPYRSGTMVVGATEGPAVNLVPQLQEILKTVALQP